MAEHGIDPEDPLSCICGKPFRRSSGLMTHIWKHAREDED